MHLSCALAGALAAARASSTPQRRWDLEGGGGLPSGVTMRPGAAAGRRRIAHPTVKRDAHAACT